MWRVWCECGGCGVGAGAGVAGADLPAPTSAGKADESVSASHMCSRIAPPRARCSLPGGGKKRVEVT